MDPDAIATGGLRPQPGGGAAHNQGKGHNMLVRSTLSALAIALAAPAFAASQLELSAGVQPGIYSQAELGLIAAAETPHEANRLKKFFATDDASTVSRSGFAAQTGKTDAFGQWIRPQGDDR